MDKQLAVHALEKHADGYRKKHPATADMDLPIFKAYCDGKSAVKISMDVPCAESTVYRAIRRVESYLEHQSVKAFTGALRKHLSQMVFSQRDWDANSILELLYCAYNEACYIETDQIKENFEELYELLGSLSIKEMDPIIDVVRSLCRNHEETGFVEGVKVGVRMIDELNG